MEIHSRHDILRASGLLLSVDCAQNGLQTSALLLADLALIWLLMSNWGLFFLFIYFFICELHSWCPVCLLCCPRAPFYTLLKHLSLTTECSLGRAFDTNAMSSRSKSSRCAQFCRHICPLNLLSAYPPSLPCFDSLTQVGSTAHVSVNLSLSLE